MSASDLIEDLLQIHPSGFDLSLDRMLRLLVKLDNPHLKIPPAIHVAGTNGKGSTIATCRAILEAAGKTVHVDTSPHLVRWHERFRLGKPGGGELVSDPVLADAVKRVAEANSGQLITVFEILTAVSFVLFSEHPADYSLIEVGLGGRFDCTNVIENPAATIITPIDLDHQAFLGDTLEEIAFEKAGILKPGVPVICGVQKDEAYEVIEARANALGCELISAGRTFDCFEQNGRFVYQDLDGLLDMQLPALPGEHQYINAAAAIAAMRRLLPDLPNQIFDKAMGEISWPARMQRLRVGNIPEMLGENTEIWLDGGHNPAAGRVVAEYFEKANAAQRLPTNAICAMLNTKDPVGYFEALKGFVGNVICIPIVTSNNSIQAEDLANHAMTAGLDATVAPDLAAALEAIKANQKKEPNRLLLSGSLYLAGDVLAFNGTPPN